MSIQRSTALTNQAKVGLQTYRTLILVLVTNRLNIYPKEQSR